MLTGLRPCFSGCEMIPLLIRWLPVPAHISEMLCTVPLSRGVSSRVGTLGGLVCVFRVAFSFYIFGSTHDYGLNCARPFVLWFQSLKEEKKNARVYFLKNLSDNQSIFLSSIPNILSICQVRFAHHQAVHRLYYKPLSPSIFKEC